MNLLPHDSTLRNVTVFSITGKYLGQMGITPADTTDNSGCKRFQRYNVNYVMGTQTHSVSSTTHSLSNKMVSPPCCILLCSIVIVGVSECTSQRSAEHLAWK
jgi:hypothetical protein